MARVRFLGAEPVTVPELGGREIQPDELIEVPDERFGGYVSQTKNWEPVEEPPDWVWPKTEDDAAPTEAPQEREPEPQAKAPAAKKTAAAKTATSKEG